MRRLDPPLPMTRETTTWAASITKGVFATYVMQLVERGEFSLDTPIGSATAQTDRRLRRVSRDRVRTRRAIRPGRRSRRACCWRTRPGSATSRCSRPTRRCTCISSRARLHLFRRRPQPDTARDRAAERTAARSADAGRVVRPLGMTRTGIIYRTEFADNVADRYNADGTFRAQTRRFPARAAGSMTTSAEDIARFLSALFAGRILKPATMKAMLSRSSGSARCTSSRSSPTSLPASRRRASACYGLGWGC